VASDRNLKRISSKERNLAASLQNIAEHCKYLFYNAILTSPAIDRNALKAITFYQDETGATAIEYGLIAALIAVAAVSVMGTVGTRLSTTFNTIATKL
jgi:pilus assembly protein Flp/PilA